MKNYPFYIGSYRFDTLQLSSAPFTGSVPEHSHGMNSYEIHYINSGYGILIADGCRYELSPSVLYVTGPNIRHTQLLADHNPMWETCIFYKTSPITFAKNTNISETPDEHDLVSSFLTNHFWIGHDTQNILPLLENLLKEVDSYKSGSEIMVGSYLKLLLILVTRNYADTKVIPSNKNTIDLNNQRFLIIDQVFLSKYQTITLDGLAKKLGLSTRHTQRLLLEYYGFDFNHKRLQARMAQSKLLLETTDKPIYEIAELVGYTSSEHFCNMFKKHVQITATEYRKLQVKNSN